MCSTVGALSSRLPSPIAVIPCLVAECVRWDHEESVMLSRALWLYVICARPFVYVQSSLDFAATPRLHVKQL